MHLLRDLHVKVCDVAYDAGYEDPPNLARTFRSLAALSPQEFRRHAVLLLSDSSPP